MSKQMLPMWVLPLGGLLSVVPGWAQERVALPPVQPSARGVTAVNDCELRLAKMNSNSCARCEEFTLRDGFSFQTTPVCDLANVANWECRPPRVQVPQNNVTCPSGWDGTFDAQVMMERRNCSTSLTPIAGAAVTVTRNGCTRTRVLPVRESCPTGWQGDVQRSFRVTEQLNDDLRTFREVSRVALPLSNADVSCSQEVNTPVNCPTGPFANSGGGSGPATYTQTTQQFLAADLVSVARRVDVRSTVDSCPPYNCTALTRGAVCVLTAWTGNANNNREVCTRYMCGNVAGLNGLTGIDPASQSGGGGRMEGYSVSIPGGGQWSFSDRPSAEKAASFVSGITGQPSYVSRESQASPGAGAGRTVICTYFMQKGELERDLWLASARYGGLHIAPATLRGYHVWAIPYVRLMRVSPLAEKLMRPIMRARTEEIGYQMGIRKKPNYAGKAISAVMEPICYLIGLVAPQQDWESLWDPVGSTVGVRI